MPKKNQQKNCFGLFVGLHSSYDGHEEQIDPELRAALSPDCHVTPIFDERSFQSPLYHSPTCDPYMTNGGITLTQPFP